MSSCPVFLKLWIYSPIPVFYHWIYHRKLWSSLRPWCHYVKWPSLGPDIAILLFPRLTRYLVWLDEPSRRFRILFLLKASFICLSFVSVSLTALKSGDHNMPEILYLLRELKDELLNTFWTTTPLTIYKSRHCSLNSPSLMYCFELGYLMFPFKNIKYPSEWFNIKDYITFSKQQHHLTGTSILNCIARLSNTLSPIDITSSLSSIKSTITNLLLW